MRLLLVEEQKDIARTTAYACYKSPIRNPTISASGFGFNFAYM